MNAQPLTMPAPATDPATRVASIERLLTLKAVAEAGGVSRWTVWRWHAEAGLRVVKIGGVCRVRESDWRAFIGRHLTGGEVKQ